MKAEEFLQKTKAIEPSRSPCGQAAGVFLSGDIFLSIAATLAKKNTAWYIDSTGSIDTIKLISDMKKEIHPEYHNDAKVICACGNAFTTGSTVKEIRVEICSQCHPFYTGKQKLVDTAGRVDRFKKIMEKKAEAAKDRKGKKAKRAQRAEKKEEKEQKGSEK